MKIHSSHVEDTDPAMPVTHEAHVTSSLILARVSRAAT
jgi:hypothetical protein